MGKASIGSLITSIINYLQRLGITVDQKKIPLPSQFQKVFSKLLNLISLIQEFTDVPDIDIRAQLVILCVGVPFLVDLGITGVFSDLFNLTFHVIDFFVFVAAFYFSCIGIIEYWDAQRYVFLVLCWIYIVVRFIILYRDRNKGKAKLSLVHDICGYYLNGIMPGAKSKLCFKDLNHSIHLASDLIVIIPKKESTGRIAFGLIMGFILFFIGIIISGLLDSLFTIPYLTPVFQKFGSFRYIFAGICWLISIGCFVVFFMRITK